MTEQEREIQKNKQGALFVPAGVILGTGLGFAYRNIPAGTLIGLGLGFVVYAIISTLKK